MKTNTAAMLSKQTAIYCGLAGIIASVLLFIGDMLFYLNGDQTNLIVNMANVSADRIINSGICALLSAWLYTIASGQIYYAFQPATRRMQLTIFFSFLAIMIAFGVVHAAYIAIATSAKNAAAVGMPAGALTELAIAANNTLRTVSYLPFAIFTAAFIYAVWQKHSHYPRWMLLFCPIIPFLLNDFIVSFLDGQIYTIIAGGYLNLILLLFFTTSTIALITHKSILSTNNDSYDDDT